MMKKIYIPLFHFLCIANLVRSQSPDPKVAVIDLLDTNITHIHIARVTTTHFNNIGLIPSLRDAELQYGNYEDEYEGFNFRDFFEKQFIEKFREFGLQSRMVNLPPGYTIKKISKYKYGQFNVKYSLRKVGKRWLNSMKQAGFDLVLFIDYFPEHFHHGVMTHFSLQKNKQAIIHAPILFKVFNTRSGTLIVHHWKYYFYEFDEQLSYKELSKNSDIILPNFETPANRQQPLSVDQLKSVEEKLKNIFNEQISLISEIIKNSLNKTQSNLYAK